MNVISLSSIPPRLDKIGPGLESLMAQTAQIDRVILYIPQNYRRFPDYDGSLPDVPAGVEIRRPTDDLGPATKLLYALQDFKGQDCNILFSDDDLIFAPTWAQGLLDEATAHPGCCIAISAFDIERTGLPGYERALQPRVVRTQSRGRKYRLQRIAQQLDFLHLFTPRHKPTFRNHPVSGYADILEGVGGVLVRPEFFDDEVFEVPEQLWTVDDIWLSGHLARMNVPIWASSRIDMPFEMPALTMQMPLFKATIEGLDRTEANQACIKLLQDRYGIWL